MTEEADQNHGATTREVRLRLAGKIPAKEEGVEKVGQGIGKPWCGKAPKVWKADIKKGQ